MRQGCFYHLKKRNDVGMKRVQQLLSAYIQNAVLVILNSVIINQDVKLAKSF